MIGERFKVDHEIGVLDTKTNEIVCDTANAKEVVDLINSLYEENEQLRKDVENLQEVVAELGATLLMHGFEIEINDENLSEMIDNG